MTIKSAEFSTLPVYATKSSSCVCTVLDLASLLFLRLRICEELFPDFSLAWYKTKAFTKTFDKRFTDYMQKISVTLCITML